MFVPEEIRKEVGLYLLELDGIPVAQFLELEIQVDRSRLVLFNGLSADLTLDHWYDDTVSNPGEANRSGSVVAMSASNQEVARVSFEVANLAIYEGPQHDHHSAQGPVTRLALDCDSLI